MNDYTALIDKEGNEIRFTYPITIEDEKLGLAVNKALELCK